MNRAWDVFMMYLIKIFYNLIIKLHHKIPSTNILFKIMDNTVNDSSIVYDMISSSKLI